MTGSGTASTRLTVPVSVPPRDAQGAVVVTFGLQGSLTTAALRRVDVPGVYPLELALRTDETLASFVTWIVVADPLATPADTDPVRLASVWSVVAAPLRDADGPERQSCSPSSHRAAGSTTSPTCCDAAGRCR